MLKISRIRICNYKGIKDSGWLEFAELNAIVGKNDAGKSAVLLAINEFFNGSKLMLGDQYYGSENEETSFELLFSGEYLMNIPRSLLDEQGYLHIQKSASNVGDSYKYYITVYECAEERYQNLIQQTLPKLRPIFSGLGKDVPEKLTRENVFELMVAIGEQASSYVINTYEVKGSLLKDVLQSLYPQFSLFLADTNLDVGASAFQNQFKKIITSAIENHLESVVDLQRNITATMNEEISTIKQYMSTHYSGLADLSPNIKYDWSKLINFDVVMKDSTGYEINIANKGTGVQRLFMVSYFQYLAEKTCTEGDSYVFAIEEPETFLHPGAQRVLLNSLKAISENHQVILTTHSPVFASEINNENIIVAKKDEKQSKYYQKEQVSSEQLVEELGVRANDSIINSKLLIFVEGSNDVKFWDIIYRKITGRSYMDDGILFLPGGGNELHNIAEMNLMHRLNRNFMVIVDKDSGAVDYATKLEKQNRLKTLVESKGGQLVVLRKREIENYYSPSVVCEMLSEKGFEIDNIEISDYEDVQRKIKQLFAGRQVQFKIKNNLEVFERMSLDQWKAVSSYCADGLTLYEFEEIIESINERL